MTDTWDDLPEQSLKDVIEKRKLQARQAKWNKLVLSDKEVPNRLPYIFKDPKVK